MVIPMTPHVLLINVAKVKKGGIAFLGYRQFPNGLKGLAELKNLVRYGDIIIAVNGQSIVTNKLEESLAILKRSTQFAFLRLKHGETEAGGHVQSH